MGSTISHGIQLQYTDTCDAKKIIATALTVRKDDVLERFWPRMNADQIKNRSKYVEDGKERIEIIEILEAVSKLATS